MIYWLKKYVDFNENVIYIKNILEKQKHMDEKSSSGKAWQKVSVDEKR